MNIRKKLLKNIVPGLTLVTSMVLLLQVSMPGVLALSQNDLNSIIQHTPFYDDSSSATCSTGTNTTGTTSSGASQNTAPWSSGLQPPYYLEAFAIEVLKDVAAKQGVPQSDAVTPQHVVSMVGWAWSEGGDITNDDLFNPYNTGQGDPGFLATAHSVSGVQSYVSFDAGVEETSRAIVGSYQNRIASVLTKPTSTATDFVQALTYFQKYPGNLAWASADNPSSGNAQQNYYNSVLTQVQQAATNYQDEAATIIGTAAHEGNSNQKVPSSELKFNGTTVTASASSATTNCTSSNSGVVSGNIVQTAINFSWPDRSPQSIALQPKPEYEAALQKYNPDAPYNGADCGAFVGTVMHASGADTSYPLSFTVSQAQYVLAHPEKYDVAYTVTDTSQLQPGDILILNAGSYVDASGYHVGNGAGGEGHTFIWVGPQPPNGYNEASASGGDRMANLGPAELSDSRGIYMRARLKQ
ncbi:MAG TPA: hypothetical protein VLF90_01770 [Patescibacteria group bacterium]|nr:hypothetical protein [Patescibacteria group bacterium]